MKIILIAIICFLGMFISYSYAGNMEEASQAYGKGDYKTAYNLFLIEAKKGNAVARYNLGAMYSVYNRGLLQDYKEAMKWYRLAADQGLPRLNIV